MSLKNSRQEGVPPTRIGDAIELIDGYIRRLRFETDDSPGVSDDVSKDLPETIEIAKLVEGAGKLSPRLEPVVFASTLPIVREVVSENISSTAPRPNTHLACLRTSPAIRFVSEGSTYDRNELGRNPPIEMVLSVPFDQIVRHVRSRGNV
jgi:hypothetical protein